MKQLPRAARIRMVTDGGDDAQLILRQLKSDAEHVQSSTDPVALVNEGVPAIRDVQRPRSAIPARRPRSSAGTHDPARSLIHTAPHRAASRPLPGGSVSAPVWPAAMAPAAGSAAGLLSALDGRSKPEFAMNDEPRLPPATLPSRTLSADRPVVTAALTQWSSVVAALSPIIGLRGVTALFHRSLKLRQAEHPCLAPVRIDVQQPDALAPLETALLEGSEATAAAAHEALLKTFVDLLGALIGPALAERLTGLGHVPPSTTTAAQDPPP